MGHISVLILSLIPDLDLLLHPEPSISSVEVTRLNRTTFNLSVSLAYTGGGAITHFRISFRNTENTSWIPLGEIPAIPSPDSSLVWNWVVSRDEFATYSQVEFLLSVINEHGFESNTSHTVCKFVCNLIVPHFSCQYKHFGYTLRV